LGKGSAATVKLGTYLNENVAVKILTKTEKANYSDDSDSYSFSKVFAEFRREAFLMSNFVHPNLVGLRGICLEPLALVSEFFAIWRFV